MELPRWILHVDMDAFFASVEQLDDPSLRGKPVLVGGERGVVSTASYEARAFGIHSAMPMFQARKLCPQAVILRGRYGRYSELSQRVMHTLREFSPLVEPASIDEAYVDLTGLERVFGDTRALAGVICAEIRARTQLSCSAGLAPVKFIAKIASDMKKPGGLTIVGPEDIPALLAGLPVGKIPGVGRQTLQTLHALGIQRAGEVLRFPAEFWSRKLGKSGESLFRMAQGIDAREVETEHVRKSESAENTFAHATRNREELLAWLLHQAERVGASLRRHGLAGRTITLKVKYADFTQHTRSRTLKDPTNATRVIFSVASELLEELNPQKKLRLIGCGLSNFGESGRQLTLLPQKDEEESRREHALDTTLDRLRSKFGSGAVVRGRLFGKK